MTFSITVVVIYAMFLNSMFLFTFNEKWVASLNRPRWVPSNSIIIHIWPVMHALSSMSIALIYEQTGGFQELSAAYLAALLTSYITSQLTYFFLYQLEDLQLAFWNSLAAAFTVCLLLLATVSFSKTAAGLLLPCLIWSCITALTLWKYYQEHSRSTEKR
jgi:benzodiazapine receptor